jgi:hypothetical protein
MQPGEVGELSFSVSGNDVSELSPNIERHATAIVSVTPPDFFFAETQVPRKWGYNFPFKLVWTRTIDRGDSPLRWRWLRPAVTA